MIPEDPPPTSSLTSRLLGLWVMVLLGSGLVSWWLGAPVPAIQGNRPLAAKPSDGVPIGSATWLRLWTQWMKERLPLRYWAIQTRNATQLALAEKLHPLPVSPGNWLVSVGKEGWLFFGEQAAVVPRKDTHQKTAENAVKLVAKMQSTGRRFFLAMVPDKLTIYPERAPTVLLRADRWSRRTEMERLMREAFAEAGLQKNYLDWPALLRASRDKDIWCPHDTHWNETGAMIAVKDLLARLQPDLVAGADFVSTGSAPMANDLRSNMLLLPGLGAPSPRYQASRSAGFVAIAEPRSVPGIAANPILTWTCTHPDVIPGHTVVVVDSFMQTTGSLMSPWFEKLTFIHESHARHPIMLDYLTEADTIVWTSIQRIIRGRLQYWCSDAMPAPPRKL